MTAEIAILNKSAVALASDSAVTISVGDREVKIYDSADKLFELSHTQPIAIMIYNGMNFCQIPLPSLIKQFRDNCGQFDRIADAAVAFLRFLNEIGQSSPSEIQLDELRSVADTVLSQINDRFLQKFQQSIAQISDKNVQEVISNISVDVIGSFERLLVDLHSAQFVGKKSLPKANKAAISLLSDLVSNRLVMFSSEHQAKVVELLVSWLKTADLSPRKTGIVFAGFGTAERFPTLISCETDGIIFGHLKYIYTNKVDIDRHGPRAAVVPFAQKEMVERFLYGLDDAIKRSISTFCSSTIPSIRTEIFSSIDFGSDIERIEFENKVKEIERRFLKGLADDAFEKIRLESKREIEDMVEFMPKPEMATMAEALVNLTSIKRRVSRGMETVGGPIDVAVISQSEGLVWVKRKHYFPAELNHRHVERVRGKLARLMEGSHGTDSRKEGNEPKQEE